MGGSRASVFIGSSVEGLKIAEAIQQNLDHACEVVIWSQGVFGLSVGTLETLVERLGDFDFAILVLTPDDVTISRSEVTQAPRDNVLLELGLFIGALGRRRTFIIFDRTNPPKLPSDLAGVTPATFQTHTNGNLQASLGAPTTAIKGAIQELGKRHDKITASIDVHTQFQIIHDLLDHSAEQFIIWMFEQKKHMSRVPRLFEFGIKYEYLHRNLSGGQGAFSVDELCNKLPDADLLTINLRNEVFLSERGKQYATWLINNGHKAGYFRSDLGGWGEEPEKGGLKWPVGHVPEWKQAPSSVAEAPTDIA